jgi:hypothetical protein
LKLPSLKLLDILVIRKKNHIEISSIEVPKNIPNIYNLLKKQCHKSIKIVNSTKEKPPTVSRTGAGLRFFSLSD